MDNRRVELSLIFQHETKKAVIVKERPDDEGVWLPKSQIDPNDFSDCERGETVDIEMPKWLAEDKGLW